MPSNRPFWNDGVWKSIDDGVAESVAAIRVVQRVFKPEWLPNTTSVPAGIFDPETMSIPEGQTVPYVELAAEFRLTHGQVTEDPTGCTAITLSKFAAKSLALAEDAIILRGGDAELPQGVRIESGEEALGQGLVGLALANGRRIIVPPPDPQPTTNSGAQILSAIISGTSQLFNDGQAPPYALIEDTNAYAATCGSFINGDPASVVVKPLLNPLLPDGDSIYGTGAMPRDTGLLISLSGDPITIYVGAEAVTEPTHQGSRGLYFFRTFERIQHVARDYRAVVVLDFSYLSDARHKEGNSEAARGTAAESRRQPAKPGAGG